MYVDAAAAPRVVRRVALIIATGLLGAGLAGCESGGSLFGSSTQSTTPTAAIAQPQPPPPPPVTTKVVLAPIIGAPDAVAKQLTAKMGEAVEKQRVAVAKSPTDKGDFTLRGYVVAAKEKANTKLSYIWDVTDASGKRVHRITGEELLPAVAGKDAWAAVTPAVVDTIAGKSATQFGGWLPANKPPAAMAQAPAQQSVAPSGTGAPVAGAPAVAAGAAQASQPVGQAPQIAAKSAQAPAATQSITTASVGRAGPVAVIVPAVVGAPGDGTKSLTAAIQRELSRSGVALAERGTQGTYKVEGRVSMGQPKDGKQSIQIEWKVVDGAGQSRGTVSQKNEIPQGTLDGAWGSTADAAAQAAAQGIIKLLPAPGQATN